MAKTSTQEPDVLVQPAPEAAAPNTQPARPMGDNPPAGGSYTRDPVTGVLTLVTPATIQE